MPVPIKSIPDIMREKEEQHLMDYSFLAELVPQSTKLKKVTASNKDASLLFEIWSKSEKINDESLKVSPSINSKDILRLKSRGFLTGNNDEVKLTKKGRMVVTTMALGEPSQFEKDKERKNYNEILASMDKRGKKGYRIPKYAANNSNNLNLRET